MTMRFGYFVLLGVILVLPFSSLSQTRKKPVKKPAVPAAKPSPSPSPEPTPAVETPAKKNERPKDGTNDQAAKAYTPTYFYEFSRPGFNVPLIQIEHDEAGRGKISFKKTGGEEMFTDPIQLSTTTIAHIGEILAALDFFNSTENYQYQKDYSHLGNVTITVKKGERSRTVKYNWTENKNALALMNEYRNIASEYVWRFDISVARQNQPLETPGLMDQFIDQYGRGEVSDPPHMVPFLTELSSDERLPLIARNRAAKLIKDIEKKKK